MDIELDGHAAGKLPFVSDVRPGTHRIVLRAPGFETYTREVRILEGSVVPLDAALVAKPAMVSLRAEAGADVLVDGRLRGTTPIAPVRVSAGRHVVSVVQNGREPYAREIEVAAGKAYDVDVELEATGQRTASYVLFASSGVAVLGAGVLFGLSLKREHDAKEISERRDDGISTAELRDYHEAVDDRNAFRLAGGIALGTGLAAGALGFVLYAFDRPRPVAPGELRERGPRPERGTGSLEVSAAVPSSGGAFVSVHGAL